MTNEIVFTDKEKALVAITASVAAGCQPCTEYHVNASRRAGVCDRSIALAIETALTVRESATRNIEVWAARCAGPRPEVSPEFREQKRLIMELAAVAATVAVNSMPDVRARVESATQAGATPEQVKGAVGLATSIRGTAAQKVEAALEVPVASTAACCAAPACGCTR